MSRDDNNLAEVSPRRPQWYRMVGYILFVLAAVALVGAAWGFYYYYQWTLPPAQPIAFSHHLHVTEKNLSCAMCHGDALVSDRAGVPAMDTCMLCHSRIIIHHPQIAKLRAAYAAEQPIQWARVNDLPDFVFFTHQRHLSRGIDCGHCHGNVAMMDRVAQVHEFQMGFCVQCHRDYKASVDCWTCHR